MGAVVFLLLNLATGTRYPFVWIDEVMYADPAVNLYLGHGFTSSAWYVQPADAFWAGNVPLHSALLYVWLKVFGFSILVVRSINYVYLLCAGLLLWRASIRLGLMAGSWARLALLGLMASGYSMVFAYRSGRPDCVAMLLVCAAVYVHSLEGWRSRRAGLVALGALMPWAGLQLLPLLAVGGILLWLFVGRKILASVAAIYAGVILGGLLLVWFYRSHGVWDDFLASVRQHTTMGFFGWLAKGELRHSNLVPKDFSFMIVFVFAVSFMFKVQSLQLGDEAGRRARSAIVFGVIYSVVLTVALIFSGKFPTYYGWMTYVPLCLCVCMALDGWSPMGRWRWASVIFLTAAAGVSLLLHGVTAAADWRERDYANVEKLVTENVASSDWMYGEHASYYAAKKTGAHIFMPLYLTAFRESEKERLTVLVIAPKYLAAVTNVIGGNWVATGKAFVPERKGFWEARRNMGFLSTQNYELAVYRRMAQR